MGGWEEDSELNLGTKIIFNFHTVMEIMKSGEVKRGIVFPKLPLCDSA